MYSNNVNDKILHIFNSLYKNVYTFNDTSERFSSVNNESNHDFDINIKITFDDVDNIEYKKTQTDIENKLLFTVSDYTDCYIIKKWLWNHSINGRKVDVSVLNNNFKEFNEFKKTLNKKYKIHSVQLINSKKENYTIIFSERFYMFSSKNKTKHIINDIEIEKYNKYRNKVLYYEIITTFQNKTTINFYIKKPYRKQFKDVHQ